MMELIGNFMHVPLVICDSEDMKTYAGNAENYILSKLPSNDTNNKNDDDDDNVNDSSCANSNRIEMASAAIVVMTNINQCDVKLQQAMAKLMRGSSYYFFLVVDLLFMIAN